MTSRVFYYFSITCFVFGLFTLPFTNNVFSSFSPSIFFGGIGAVASLLESDVDRTRRDAVIALCISVVLAIALSVFAPQFGIIWWGPVVLLMETIAIVSLIRRSKRKLDSQTQRTANPDTYNTTPYAENPSPRTLYQSALFQSVHTEQSPQVRQPELLPEVAPQHRYTTYSVPESNKSSWLTGIGVVFVLMCGGIGGYLFVLNQWWVNIFNTEVNPTKDALESSDPAVCCIAIIEFFAGIFCSIAGRAGNYFITALSGVIVGMAIGLGVYGTFLAIYFAIKSSPESTPDTSERKETSPATKTEDAPVKTDVAEKDELDRKKLESELKQSMIFETRDGSFHVTAFYIYSSDKQVILKRVDNGNEVTVERSLLSDKTKALIKEKEEIKRTLVSSPNAKE